MWLVQVLKNFKPYLKTKFYELNPIEGTPPKTILFILQVETQPNS